ncbi:MAG: VanZ family protein [Chitinophagaceae bacterium]|jgi:hypothetical protein|nr:VanZ family protein [Chitinophagaceae bacterium]
MSNRFIRFVVKLIPGFLWLSISFWLFTLPGSAIPQFDLFHQLQGDKLVHAFLFVVLNLLFYYPIHQIVESFSNKKKYYFIFCLVFCLYGVAIEFIQRDYIPNRSFDLGDIIADCVGCITALVYALKKWK